MSDSTLQVTDSFTARQTMLQAHRLASTSADLNAILGGAKQASPFHFTQAISDAIDAYGIDTTAIFATDRNPKVIKRFIQFVHGVTAKEFKQIDCTSARILYAMRLGGAYSLTTDALAYLCSNALKAGAISPETRGVSTRVISRLFLSVGITTAPTQISRSVGDNGFMQLSGMTSAPRGTQNRAYVLNSAHPLVNAFFAMFENATPGQIDEVTGKGE